MTTELAKLPTDSHQNTDDEKKILDLIFPTPIAPKKNTGRIIRLSLINATIVFLLALPFLDSVIPIKSIYAIAMCKALIFALIFAILSYFFG